MSNEAFKTLMSGIKIKKKKEETTNARPIETVNTQSEGSDENLIANENRIQVYGEDIPDPISSFEEMVTEFRFSDIIRDNLKEAGFTEPTAVQMQTIPIMMKRRELITSAPTGSGKTLAFLLPIIAQLKRPKNVGFRALILVPTWELAKQIHREFLCMANGTGLRIHLINDVHKFKEKFGPRSQVNKDVVITTPKRLISLISDPKPQINLKL